MSSIVQTQVAHQVASALAAQLSPPEETRVPSIIDTIEEMALCGLNALLWRKLALPDPRALLAYLVLTE